MVCNAKRVDVDVYNFVSSMVKRAIQGFLRNCNSVRGDARAQYSWHGVSVESSTSNADELDTMLELVSALSPSDRAKIGKIFCDSDVGHCSVHLRRGNQGVVPKIVRTCASVLYTKFGSVRSLTIVANSAPAQKGGAKTGRPAHS